MGVSLVKEPAAVDDAQPMEWGFLYDHARQFAASMGDDLAHEYAAWFADFYQDDASFADHSSEVCFRKRLELEEAVKVAEERSWFDDLCESKGLRAVEPITADELRRGHVLFTATGDPREVVKVRRGSKHTAVEYADGWRDSWGNDARISLVAVKSGAPLG